MSAVRGASVCWTRPGLSRGRLEVFNAIFFYLRLIRMFVYLSNHLFDHLSKDLFVYASTFLFIRLIIYFIYLSCLFFIRLINDLFMFVCVGIPPRGNVFPGTAMEIKTCYSECSNRELLFSPVFLCRLHCLFISIGLGILWSRRG